jgi:RNA polymerase sigma-70 factor (ECF subfamily)
MERVEKLVDELYRKYFGTFVAALLSFSRQIDLEIAENLVQDSFAAALTNWRQGIPANPQGWIYAVSRNKALNWIKKKKEYTSVFYEASENIDMDIDFDSQSTIKDAELKLLFCCAHPALAPKVQVVITLKYVANFKVETIAKTLAMSIDGVDKLLVRARAKIIEEGIHFAEPLAGQLISRLSMVHQILYLIFNEGYKSSTSKELVRRELCEDALVMTRMLVESGVASIETNALYSLMLLNSARLDSHYPDKKIVDLEHQDRSTWNRDLIALGEKYLNLAKEGHAGKYLLEATIAYLHCVARDFNETNWPLIAKLYERLHGLQANPFVELNWAIALYYSGKKELAFQMLEALHRHPFFHHYFYLTSALGKLHGLEGRKNLASRFLNLAVAQTSSQSEKDFVVDMLNHL